MKNTVRVCAFCGSAHIQVMMIRVNQAPLYFCSLKCKTAFLQTVKEAEHESKTETSILPEVRIFTAHKTDKGITVVRGEGGFHGNSD